MNQKTRPAEEEDFRMPEFRTAKVEDYEVRPNGKVVRKDRFSTAVHSLAFELGLTSGDGYEVSEVVAMAKQKIALANKLSSQTPEQYVLFRADTSQYFNSAEDWTENVEDAYVHHNLNDANALVKEILTSLGELPAPIIVCTLSVTLHYMVSS